MSDKSNEKQAQAVEKLELSDDNPSPFVQPFLVLHIGRETWWVDVNGKVGEYLTERALQDIQSRKFDRESGFSAEEGLGARSTQKMKDIARALCGHGYLVSRVGIYKGSAGPSHILRHGALFCRMNELEKEIVQQETWMDRE